MGLHNTFEDAELPVVSLADFEEVSFDNRFLDRLGESRRLQIKEGLRHHGYVIFKSASLDVQQKFKSACEAALEFFSSTKKSECVIKASRIEGLPGWGKNQCNVILPRV